MYTMKREYGYTPNGNHLEGYWVLRDNKCSDLIDFGQYRNDIIDRHRDKKIDIWEK